MRAEWLDMIPAAIHPSHHVERRAAMAGDNAAVVERGLDDAVQPRRAVEHARQIHHLVDARDLLRPPFECEGRFGVADVSAGGFDRTRRRRRRDAWIDLLRQPPAGFDEVLDARQAPGRVGDLVGAFEVGRQSLGQRDLGVAARAEPAALAVIVRIHETGHEGHAFALTLRSPARRGARRRRRPRSGRRRWRRPSPAAIRR